MKNINNNNNNNIKSNIYFDFKAKQKRNIFYFSLYTCISYIVCVCVSIYK